MKLKAVLIVAAIYQAIVGVGMMLAPRQFGIDAVPPDASPALIAFLRIFGGPMLRIAVLNLVDVWGVFAGGARPIAQLFLVIHLLLTVAFVAAWRTNVLAKQD